MNCNNASSYFVILPVKGLSIVIFLSIKNISALFSQDYGNDLIT